MPELPRPLPPPTWRDRIDGVAQWRNGVPLPALALIIGVALAIVVGALAMGRAASRPDVALSLPRADAGVETAPSSASSSGTTTTAPATLHVHAAGAVLRPGVVEVPAGARVVDVVVAAGGPSPEADLNLVNLAQLVSDGERVYIPRAGEAIAAIGSAPPAPGSAAGQPAVVNINEASETELETLPGVGPATAQAIVEYRSQHGRFRSVDDLLNVRGIGPAKLEQIKPHARV